MIATTVSAGAVRLGDSELLSALYDAGFTSELRDALITDKEFTLDVVQKIEELQRQHTYAKAAEWRRDILHILLEDCALRKQVVSALEWLDIVTIGDLAMATESRLATRRNIGPQAIQEIEELLAEHEFDLLGEHEDAFVRAARLYGGAEYIPAKHMITWQSGFDNTSLSFLKSFETLGELAMKTENEFKTWRSTQLAEVELLSHRKDQVGRLFRGLAKAGMAPHGV